MANKHINTSNPKTFNLANELEVNRMGYGAMRITGDGIWGPPEDKEEAIKVLKKTIDLGINFIDTADSYGPNVSEELIAEALHPYPDGLVIATKGGFERSGPNQWSINAHPKHLQKVLEGSLKRLKLETIDLYQLHRVDPDVPFEDTMEWLQKVQQKGLVKHIGLSEVSTEEIKRAREYVDVVSVQNKYSVDFRKWEKELQYCLKENIAFIPWNPINAGNVKSLDILNTIAKKYDASAHQLALSWLLQHAPNILLIPGTSKVKHLEQNFKASDITISEEDMAELNKISKEKQE